MKTHEELLKELAEAKKEIEALKKSKEDEKQTSMHEIYKLNQELNAALLTISIYQEKYNIERTKPFIPKSEKLESIVINETEEIIKEVRKTNKGKKYNKKKFDYEKHVTETRYVESDYKSCPECGDELVKFSEKIRYAVEVIPATIKVIKLIKISKKCPNCNKTNNKIFYPVSTENIDGSILTASLAAYIGYHKYELGIPFEHLAAHITKSIGFDINKQNLANYMARTSNLLEPIYNRLKEDLLNNESKVIHSDETTIVVSKKNEENKDRKKSYYYVYTSSFYDSKQIRIYDFHETREIEPTKKWLDQYNGVIICDNYSGYDALKKSNPNIKLQKCWAHVRRRFADIVKTLKEKERKNSRAYQILKKIEELFKLERDYRKVKLLSNEIVKRRQIDMPEIKDELYELIFNVNPLKGSALELAINYTKDCWNDLFTYFDNGYVEMTNNTGERAVKPFVIQRKVFQTSGSYAGARYSGKLFSIIQTCKINNVNVENYLEYVIKNLNKLPIEDLLPYSKKLPKF